MRESSHIVPRLTVWVIAVMALLPLAAHAAASPLRRSSIEDIRVEPITQSKWNQLTSDNYVNGPLCYNYYTPNNWPCGCVATAGAQVMRHFQFPSASTILSPFINTNCAVGQTFTTFTTFGGSFDWSQMPLITSRSTPETSRAAIGRLCHDVAVACGVYYGSAYTESFTDTLAPALRRLGYSDASSAYESIVCTESDMLRAILSNLDAGRPVVVGLYDKADPDGYGHVLIADGYGYQGGKLYVHANMGWSGNQDAWYAPPDFSNDIFILNNIECVVYNIFTTEKSSSVICSGRVLTNEGRPVPGAVVSATAADASDGTPISVTTNGKGIYALILQPDKYKVTASYSGGTRTRFVTLDAGVSAETDDAGIFHIYSHVGNKCGEDFKVTPGEHTDETPEEGDESEGESGEEAPPPIEYYAGTMNTVFGSAQSIVGALHDASGNIFGTVQLKIAKGKKGSAKITATATLSNGKKAKAKAATLTFEGTSYPLTCTLPFTTPVGTMSLEVDEDGNFKLKNNLYEMREAQIGKALPNGKWKFILDESFDPALPGELQKGLLPFTNSFDVVGDKFTFAKATKVKWGKNKETKEYELIIDKGKDGSNTNLASLKLSYTAKTGMFKGSFNAYSLVTAGGKTKLAKYAVSIVGFVVDEGNGAFGEGLATCKKSTAGPWTVKIE